MKEQEILSYLKERLREIPGLLFVGEAPEDLAQIGKKYPAALISDEDLTLITLPGGKVCKRWNLSVFLYHNQLQERIDAVNELQNMIIATLFKEPTLGGNSNGLNGNITVQKGQPQQTRPDFFDPGYYENLTVRRINFCIEFYEKR